MNPTKNQFERLQALFLPFSLRSSHFWCSWPYALLVCQQSDDTYNLCSFYYCVLCVLLLSHGNRCRSLSHTITVRLTVHIDKILILIISSPCSSIVVAIIMMCGRLGALSGNLLFPVLVQVGCLPPFVMVAAVMFRKLSSY